MTRHWLNPDLPLYIRRDAALEAGRVHHLRATLRSGSVLADVHISEDVAPTFAETSNSPGSRAFTHNNDINCDDIDGRLTPAPTDYEIVAACTCDAENFINTSDATFDDAANLYPDSEF